MKLLQKVSARLCHGISTGREVDFLTGARLIDDCYSLFVESIGETEELQLVVLVTEGRLQAEEPLVVSDVDFGSGRPVRADDRSRRFALEFDRHKLISYTVMNESYGKYPKAPEAFTGRWLRVFTRSLLMDFTLETSQYLEDAFGNMSHYEIACQNHVVGVLTSAPPKIFVLAQC